MATDSDVVANDREIQDTLVMGGLLESPEAEALLASLKRGQAELVEFTRSMHEHERESIQRELERARDRRDESQTELARLKERASALAAEIEGLDLEIAEFDASVEPLFVALSSKRSSYGRRLFEQRMSELEATINVLKDRALDQERARFEYEKALHEQAIERRELCKDELERRAAALRERLDRAAKRLAAVEEQLDTMRQIGVTRTVSGFLLWAGYGGFAAFGWYLGSLLQGLAPESGSWIAQLFEQLQVNVRALYTSVGPFLATALLIGLPILAWCLVLALFAATDRFLTMFPSWTARTGRRRDRGAQGFSWLINPVSRVDRTDYVSWIARAPMLAAILLVPLLVVLIPFAPSGTPGTASALPSPIQDAYFGFLGFAIVVVIGGFVSLYVTRMVEPRWIGPDGVRLPASPLKASPELATTAALALLLLIGGELVRVLYPSVPSLWAHLAAVLLLIVLNSFCVAYGLMFRGVEKEQAALRGEVHNVELEVQRYEAVPTLSLDDEEVERFRDRLRSMEKEIVKHWEGARFTAPSATQRVLYFFRRTATPRLEDRTTGSLDADDFALEPELCDELTKSLRTRQSKEARRNQLQKQLDSVRREQTQVDVTGEVRRIHELERELFEQRRSELRAIRELELTLSRRITAGDSALRLGSFVRSSLGEG